MAPENSLKEYFKNIQSGRVAPHDPFGLSFSFLMQDDNNILTGDLADKQAMLSYLGDDATVQLYQMDIDILTKMRNMGLRDPTLIPIFTTIYWGWLGTLKITRAQSGLERVMQATAVGGFTPSNSSLSGGFGTQFAEQQRKQMDDAKKNNPLQSLMASLTGKKKPQQ